MSNQKKTYNQIREVEFDGVTVSYDELDVDFEIKIEEGDKVDSATIDLYNISKTTLKKIKESKGVKIRAGYEEFSGYIYEGKLDYATPSSTSDGGNKIHIVSTADAISWNYQFISKTYKKGSTYKNIAEDIIKTAEWNIGILDPMTHANGQPKKYIRAKTFKKTAKECLKEIAKDLGYYVSFKNSTVDMYNKHNAKVKGGSREELIILDVNNNSLFDYPQFRKEKSTKKEKQNAKTSSKSVDNNKEKYDPNRFNIKSVLRYDYKDGNSIKILNSDYIDETTFKIISCRHVASSVDMYSELVIGKINLSSENTSSTVRDDNRISNITKRNKTDGRDIITTSSTGHRADGISKRNISQNELGEF